MIWYSEQSKENVDTKGRISQTDEAKGTFGETFHLEDRGEDQWAGSLQEVRIEKEENRKITEVTKSG